MTTQLGVYTSSDNSQELNFASAIGATPTTTPNFIDFTVDPNGWVNSAQSQVAYLKDDTYSANGANFQPDIRIPTGGPNMSVDQGYQAIINGSDDQYLNGIFQTFANAGYSSFYISPDWEMNGNWFNQWSVTSSDLSDYISSFQHIANLAHSFTGAKISVIWNPNAEGPNGLSIAQQYPGNAYVDNIGIDTYGGPGNMSDTSPSDQGGTSLNALIQFAKANGKPWSLPETGTSGGDTAFIQNLASDIVAQGYQPAMMDIWDPVPGDTSEQQTPATLAAWKAAYAKINAMSGGSGGNPEALAMAVLPTENTGVGIPVTVNITGDTSAPTLMYQNDTGAFVALPTGAVVTATKATFTDPGFSTAGNHTITIEDSKNTSVKASGTVAITATGGEALSLASLPTENTGVGVPVTVNINGDTTAPTLMYSEDGGAFKALPTGAVVSATKATFTAAAFTSAGSHTIAVEDANNTAIKASGTVAIASPSGGTSPSGTVITPGVGTITDSNENLWTLTAGNVVDENGAAVAGGSNVGALVWQGGTIYGQNATTLGWSSDGPSGWTKSSAPVSASETVITPGVGGFIDGSGDVFSLTSGDVAMENGRAIPGGSGIGKMEFYSRVDYGQIASTGQWETYNPSTQTWTSAWAPPAPSTNAVMRAAAASPDTMPSVPAPPVRTSHASTPAPILPAQPEQPSVIPALHS